EQRDSELEIMLLKEAREVFDLEHEPALRVRLFRLGAEKHVLTVVLHHLISDGWSQGIFQRELWQAYEALAGGKEPLIASLPIQYADFAVWQKEWLASEDAKQHLEYWMKSLAGPLPVLDFPTDFSPGQRSIVRGAVEGMQLPRELIGQLRKLSQSEHATMFM